MTDEAHPDKHLKQIITRFGLTGQLLDDICTEIKQAITLDVEAHRLFCKEIIRKKIQADGKPVEGSEFNYTAGQP